MTSYLRDTCNIDFPINNKTGKFKGFAFIRAPAHITDELIKLDDIAYHENELRVEDTTSTRKRTRNNISNKSRRPSIVVNNYPENQHLYGRKSSASEKKCSKRKKQIVIFSDSIPHSIRLPEFNYWLHKGYGQLKSFPGGTSKELLYYLEPTFKSKKFDNALLRVGVNDVLNDESQDSVKNLRDNSKQIGLKCKSSGFKRDLISGIVVKNKLTSA